MEFDNKCKEIIYGTIHAALLGNNKTGCFEVLLLRERTAITLTEKLCENVFIRKTWFQPQKKEFISCKKICTDVSKIIADKLLEAMEEINKL